MLAESQPDALPVRLPVGPLKALKPGQPVTAEQVSEAHQLDSRQTGQDGRPVRSFAELRSGIPYPLAGWPHVIQWEAVGLDAGQHPIPRRSRLGY
jgi:hypothetical protein